MKHFFLSMLGTIAGLFVAVFLFFLFIMAIGMAAGSKTEAPGNILDIDLRAGMTDQNHGGALFGGEAPALIDYVQKITQAKTDDDIKGIFIRANPYGMSPSYAEELRLALVDFKASGKFIMAHAQGFEGTSPFNYMAVSAADDIWLQDTATFSVAGVRSEVGFMGGVFEKFGAKAEFIQFHEYKNAVNSYTQSDFTDAHRESLTAMVGSLYDSTLNAIAHDRSLGGNTDTTKDAKLDAAALDARISRLSAFFDDAPHSAEQAKAAGLVDSLGHFQAAREAAKERAGEGSDFLPISAYSIKYNSGPLIAIIGGEGGVMTGSSGTGNPFNPSLTMGSDTLSVAITDASEDDKVKAILFRVNSPGGSAIASDQIWDAVNRAKESGKPVIVSMGQYAASGGYYVAANADKIVAMPTTLTGSIGVYGGKIALGELHDKLGYNVAAISKGGEYTAAYASGESWTPELREKYRRSMEDIYVDFTGRVAEGRDIPIERVREIAKGRVWTGEQAIKVGLIDELGGFMRAIEVAKDVAEIDADTQVRLKTFPKPPSTSEQIEQLLSGSVEIGSDLTALKAVLDSPEVKALLAAREAANISAQDRSLMADIPVIK